MDRYLSPSSRVQKIHWGRTITIYCRDDETAQQVSEILNMQCRVVERTQIEISTDECALTTAQYSHIMHTVTHMNLPDIIRNAERIAYDGHDLVSTAARQILALNKTVLITSEAVPGAIISSRLDKFPASRITTPIDNIKLWLKRTEKKAYYVRRMTHLPIDDENLAYLHEHLVDLEDERCAVIILSHIDVSMRKLVDLCKYIQHRNLTVYYTDMEAAGKLVDSADFNSDMDPRDSGVIVPRMATIVKWLYRSFPNATFMYCGKPCEWDIISAGVDVVIGRSESDRKLAKQRHALFVKIKAAEFLPGNDINCVTISTLEELFN